MDDVVATEIMVNSVQLKMVALLCLCVLLSIDSYYAVSYGKHAAAGIGWRHVAGAVLTQCLVLGISLLAIASKESWLRHDKAGGSLDNLRRVSCAVVFVLVGIGFSIDLLRVGIMCPHAGLPASRGKPVCDWVENDGVK